MLLWDIDGVLIWHHPTDPAQDWRSRLAKNGILDMWESFQMSPLWQECLTSRNKCVRKSWFSYVQDQGIHCKDTEGIIELWLNNNVRPNETALEYLKKIIRTGYPCAIASNQEAQRAGWLMGWLQKQELEDLRVFISCDMGVAKPQAAFFSQIEKELKKSGNMLTLLDDRMENIVAAQKQGWNACQITPGFRWSEFYKDLVKGKNQLDAFN